MKLSLVIQTPEVVGEIPVALLSGSFEVKLQKASQMGANGVELMPSDPAALDPAAIKANLGANGLEAAAVGSGGVRFVTGLALLHPDPEKQAQAALRLNDLIDFAAAIGAPLVTIGSFRGWEREFGPAARESLLNALRRGGDVAGSQGVRIALEPLNRYEADLIRTAEGGLEFLDALDQPAVGLLLDTYHVNIEESSWTAPFERLMAAEKLWHVHLGDNNRHPPGDGLIDFGAIVATLQGLGYTGYLSAELLSVPNPDSAAQRTLSYMRSLMEAGT